MKKLLISFMCLLVLLFSGCSKAEDSFVKNIKISKNENEFIIHFQIYNFSSQEEAYSIQQYSSDNIFSLCINAVNENRYNFRLCENICIDAVLLQNDFNRIFSVINSLRIPPSANMVCFLENMEFETDIYNLIKTPLYYFSKDIDGVDGIISFSDIEGNNAGAVIVDDGNAVKYLDQKQWLIFNMLTGDRNGFSLLLRNIEINVSLDWCDVYRTSGKITITTSLKDFKGISDTELIKSFLEMEITDIVYVLLNDPITGKMLSYDNNITALPDIEINIL